VDVLLEAVTRVAFESVLPVRRFASCRGHKRATLVARVLADADQVMTQSAVVQHIDRRTAASAMAPPSGHGPSR
jgi:hypothetical protein